MMADYWITSGFLLFFTIVALVTWFLTRRKHGMSLNITAHVALVAAMFGLILTFRQITYMLLDTYKIAAITPDMVNMGSAFAMVLVAMQQVFRLINRLTRNQISRGNDPTSARMIARVLKLSIFVLIMLLFGEHFGIGISGLLAFGGIGGIAIGVAGKDMLSNFFAGAMLYFDRPFSIGDWIKSPDRNIEGIVVEIGWLLTKIRTFENRPLYVPNAIFSNISVENPGLMTNRRIVTTIGLRYEDAGKISGVVNDVDAMLKANDKIDQTQELLVYFNEFAGSSLNIMVYCYTKTTHWAEWLAAQQEIYLKIIDIVQAHGAEFAFTSETLYVQGSGIEPPEKSPQNIAKT